MKKYSLNKTALIVGMAFLGAFSTSQVLAQTEEVRNTRTFTSSLDKGGIIQIGEPSGNLEPLKGFAKDLPLLTVLKQITPNGWVVKKNDTEANKLDVQQLVSWDGGKSWVSTLESIAKENNLNALVHWNNKEIVVSPTRKTVSNTVSALPHVVKKEEFSVVQSNTNTNAQKSSSDIFELEGSQTNEIGVGSSQALSKKEIQSNEIRVEVSQVTVTPVVPARSSYSWTFNSNKSLKENVEDWGKKVGYKIVWNGEDYPIDEGDDRVFGGAFDAENGPVHQLSKDYGPKSRVRQPLAFQFYQNSTLVVDDWKFEQQGFPQYSQD